MIRKARKADLEAILGIEQRCFKHPWNRDQYLYEMNENPYCQLWVMERDGKVIGFYDLWLIFEQAEIANIAIDVPWQHHGLGEQLMQHLENLARENGCETIGLEVRVSNQRAISLYERSGFFIVNTRPGYYKDPDGFEDAYRMMKGI
ncbi:MAG: ribosomal protein S18-alanine N-acetyltransferase [Erysipelotrichaceae bacterium]|nr:ribosomal protein S18-alanine N-acetyltransferase [Erysipelotrichaceae bacterium]